MDWEHLREQALGNWRQATPPGLGDTGIPVQFSSIDPEVVAYQLGGGLVRKGLCLQVAFELR